MRSFAPLVCLVIVLAASVAAAGGSAQRVAALRAQAERSGSVRVIVRLGVPSVPEPSLPDAATRLAQRLAIAREQEGVLRALSGSGERVTRRFRSLPYLALEATPEALARLAASPRVAEIQEDRLHAPSLDQSVPQVEGDLAHDAGFDGTGSAVAILDTGVDSGHPAFGSRVVEEACFSGGEDCPDGSDEQTGSGSAAPCAYAPDGCEHGTHVAGIAAGADATWGGMAPGADIIAVQIFSRFVGSICNGESENPCALAYTSDIVAGLEHVLALSSQYDVAAVNLSLGGGAFGSQTSCDLDDPVTRAAIESLRAAGVASVVASGNEYLSNAISTPGCLTPSVSVGAVEGDDDVASFSNSASFLSLLAPGVSIRSAVPGGSFANKSGTSMATPHVTGAWALLRQAAPGASVDTVLAALQTSGLPVEDSRNQVVTPRIRVLRAIDLVLPEPDCKDGLDNDFDGLVDYPDDPGCFNGSSAKEDPACSNGEDDDQDSLTDHPADPGCRLPSSPREDPECSDGMDNDDDGRTDFDGAGVGQPDPDCRLDPTVAHEAPLPPLCGLGWEAVLPAVALLLRSRRGRRQRRRI